MNLTTEQIVRNCLKQRKEGDYWDFKRKWPEKTEDVIKDIICFANTVHNKKCYIIFGMTDDLKIIGVKEEERKKEANIRDALGKLQFAKDIRPKITFEPIYMENKLLDVLIIDDVLNTPIYLNKQYGEMIQGCIYSREGDRNTPDRENALPSQIEALWKKRFGLIKSPLDYIIEHLTNKNEWKRTNDGYFYICKPEYKLYQYDDEEDNQKNKSIYYAWTQFDKSTHFTYLDVKMNETVLDTYQIAHLDNNRLRIPTPDFKFIHGCQYGYYIKNSASYKVLEFLRDKENEDENIAFNKLSQIILIFETTEEQNAFEKYLEYHLDEFKKRKDNISVKLNLKEQSWKEPGIKDDIKTGQALNEMLLEWKSKK